MQTFADWGAEYVKVDSCSRNCTAGAGVGNATTCGQELWSRFTHAIEKTVRAAVATPLQLLVVSHTRRHRSGHADCADLTRSATGKGYGLLDRLQLRPWAWQPAVEVGKGICEQLADQYRSAAHPPRLLAHGVAAC